MQCLTLRVDQIDADSARLRKAIDAERLEGLANSVDEVGLLHPVLVKRSESGYTLVAGTRRLKAAMLAGRTTIKATVLADDLDLLQVQLVENLQRDDLNPLERAEAVQVFIQKHDISKSAAAKRLGVPRTTLTDWLDLLEVPQRFRDAVVDNFDGGDSPLTPSHVSEACALAVKLKSPHLSEVLLDAVLKHKLSKAETRRVAQIVRENRDVSVEDAITAVRREYCEHGDHKPADEKEPLWPDQENLARLVDHLSRSTRYLERLNHLSGRFIDEAEIERLTEQYIEIQELASRALARLRQEDPELLEAIERQKALERLQQKRGRRRRVS